MSAEREAAAPRALQLFGLCMLAVAQPLFAVLSEGLEFFVAHDLSGAGIAAVVAAVSLVPAAAVVGLFGVAHAVSPGLGRAVHSLLVAILVALIALPLARAWPGPAALAVAVAVGIAAALLLRRVALVRTFATWLAPVSLVFPATFLFGVLGSRAEGAGPGAAIQSDTPVIVVVFDELSLVSLLDATGQVDAERFPHFAALAQGSVWFRNATAVADNTADAVPALVTGRRPGPERRAPDAAHHPDNLFTLLSGSHDLFVVEGGTRLCPADACPRPQTDPLPERARALADDLAVAYAHIVTPAAWSAALPDLDTGWKGFGRGGGEPPEKRFRRFLAAIERPTTGPALYYLHLMLPHIPWQHLPSGARYLAPHVGPDLPGWVKPHWVADPWLPLQGYQRYLLQLQFTDRLLGELVATARAAGLWDRALVIVASDHGVSFRPLDFRRRLSPTNAADMLPVPLFVKPPGLREGRVDDRNVETIDLLPTIAAALGAEIPWAVDGVDVLDPDAPERGEKRALQNFRRLAVEYAPRLAGFDDALAHHLGLLGAASRGPAGLYAIGPFGDLVGRRVTSLEVGEPSAFRARLDHPLPPADGAAGWVPARLKGRIEPPTASEPLHLALAVDGVVRATTRSYASGRARKPRFTALVPESAAVARYEDTAVFEIQGDPGAPRLLPMSGVAPVADAAARETIRGRGEVNAQ